MATPKGVSGNPRGRPKRSPAVLAMVYLAREHVPEAIEVAQRILSSTTEDSKTRLAAATFLRDTGIGKPSNVEFDLAQVSDEALAAEVARRAQLRATEEQRGMEAGSLDA